MRYIIGGGISGLIFAFYNKEYKIITPEIGGQLNCKYNLGPRYLHCTPESESLLKNLDLDRTIKMFKIGYIYDEDNKKVTKKKPDINFRKEYYKKSRGIKENVVLENSIMTGNKNYFFAYKIDMAKIVHALEKKIEKQIIKDRIVKIDTLHQKIFGKKEYHYTNLFSTIPKNIFLKLANCQTFDEYESNDITYAIVNKKFFDLKDFDYAYCADNKNIFHRITQYKNYLVLDIFGNHSKKYIQNSIEEKVIDIIILKNAQLIENSLQKAFKNVFFLGRYAQWIHRIKTEEIIKFSKNYGK